MSAVEIEDAILKHPQVREAAAIGVADSLRGQVVKAFSSPTGRATRAFEHEIQDVVRQRLSHHDIRASSASSPRPGRSAGRQGQPKSAARARAGHQQIRSKKLKGRKFACWTPPRADSRRSPKRAGRSAQAHRVAIGVTAEPWCYEATRDNIRHYAHGIGDDNPLWCDPDYAPKTTKAAIHRAAELPVCHEPHRIRLCRGLPGVHAMWSGADWTWHKAVKRNDVIRPKPG